MKRREAREKALQALFQIEMSGTDPQDAIRNVLDEGQPNEFLKDLIIGTSANLKEIDEEISKHLERWSIDRLGKVDLSVLRIGTYELKFTDVPPNVVINEAVEVAKTFGDEKSGQFVNGILSKIKGEDKE